MLGAAQRITLVSLNDVYKLVPLTSDLTYYYLEADLDYLDDVAAAECDGTNCVGDLSSCGLGLSWESCFPARFGKAEKLSLLERTHAQQIKGVNIMAGPCASNFPGAQSKSQNYGGLVDFGATFRWVKEEATFRGDVVLGTFAGDFIAPSYLAEIFRGSQLVEMMNLMGVDLANIGNHDIDFGLPNLRAQMGKSAFHYLNSNLQEDVGKEIQQPMLNSLQVKGSSGDYDVSIWRRLHQIPGSSSGRGWAVLAQDGIKNLCLGHN